MADSITFKGNPMTLTGSAVKVGDTAPDVTLVATDMSEHKISEFRGKTVILSVVPSLDTPVCQVQTRTFNEKAAGLGDDVVILTVSRDLPFAQKRWCGGEGIAKVKTLSDYKTHEFGSKYGLLIKELGLLARAVLVIDPSGKIVYKQVVPEVTHEPKYDDVLAAV
jgi:thiol peroxidase